MMLIEETTVPDTALPVAEFKAHLRLGTGFGEESLQDSVLKSFLRAAIAAIEARTGKILITREFSWSLTGWRDRSGQALPVSPVTEISRVTLIDALEIESELPSYRFRLEKDSQRPRLRPTDSLLPMVRTGGSVRINFRAGFAPTWGELPADLGQAVLLLAAHYYEYRNETALSDGCMPFGVSSLLQRYRVMRIGIGSVQ
ncbi:head-tail connector protein [Sedimentitalea sp. JM2-8]|uniref:Head-tail connector protein n=1 Tax=Sedimentitalea xiamensis TaxID=3050037 RepID=A0ABT7FDP0_9RHOB|nr:head-tail connector protein [Sedimentitalea xiamensis]MDK3072944.1 head-tail connector protein [Sedimentitalea xiamensis]